MNSRPTSPNSTDDPEPAPGKHPRTGLDSLLLNAVLLGLALLLVISFVLGDIRAEREQQRKAAAAAAATDLPALLQTCVTGGSPDKLSVEYDAALRYLACQRGIGLQILSAVLAENAARVLSAPAASPLEKITALQQAGKFVQARDLAVDEACRLQKKQPRGYSPAAAGLWVTASQIEVTLGQHAKAIDYAALAVDILELPLREPPAAGMPPGWAAACYQQGLALIAAHQGTEAQALFEQLLRHQYAAVGPAHPTVLQTRIALGTCLLQQQNRDPLDPKDDSLTADCVRHLGAEHPITLASRMHHVAVRRAHPLAYDMGKEIVQEMREIVAIQQRVLGPMHPATLASRLQLAADIPHQYGMGWLEASAQEYQEVRLIQQRVLGADHPATLDTREKLVDMRSRFAQDAETEQESRAVLAERERQLSPAYAGALTSLATRERQALSARTQLAEVLYSQHNIAAGNQELRTVLHTQERTLGPDHPDTQATRQRLISILLSFQDAAAAEQEIRALHQSQQRTLGEWHSTTLATLRSLIEPLEMQHQGDKVLEVYRAVYQIKQRTHGGSDSGTRFSQEELIRALHAAHRHAETEPEYVMLMQVGKDAPAAKRRQRDALWLAKAGASEGLGKYTEAEPQYRALLRVQEQEAGPQAPEVAPTCYRLALCLKAQKKLREALPYMQRAEQLWASLSGPADPDALEAKAQRERIEAEMK